jgi:hypothetical protein
MKKKAFISYFSILLLFIIFVLVKQNMITKKNEKPAISFYSSWKAEGKPVLVEKVQKNDLENTWKMTLSLESDNTYAGYIPKSVQRSISTDSPVYIHFHDTKFPATITYIDSAIRLDSGMYLVKISCQEKLGEKEEKYLAEVTTFGMKNVVILPYDAIHTENNQSFVWVIKDGKAHKQFVTLSEKNNRGVMALGIEEKELVILNGSEFIKENDFVKINYGN